MFTGLIEEIGEIINKRNIQNAIEIEIKANKVLKDIKLGDSICTNGVCLTVTEFTENSFKAFLMPESLSKTTFIYLSKNSKVNLERALTLSQRLNGHLVQGHIDGIGKIINIIKFKESIKYLINADKEILKLMVKKGSVAIDGISLTISNTYEDSFEISIIPMTMKDTIISLKNIGDYVNIETDIICKYIEKLTCKNNKNKIDYKFLKENGF